MSSSSVEQFDALLASPVRLLRLDPWTAHLLMRLRSTSILTREQSAFVQTWCASSNSSWYRYSTLTSTPLCDEAVGVTRAVMFEVDAQFRLRGLVERGLVEWVSDLVLEREHRARLSLVRGLARKHVVSMRDRLAGDPEVAARDVVAWWAGRAGA